MKVSFAQAGISLDLKNADAGVFFGQPTNPDVDPSQSIQSTKVLGAVEAAWQIKSGRAVVPNAVRAELRAPWEELAALRAPESSDERAPRRQSGAVQGAEERPRRELTAAL